MRTLQVPVPVQTMPHPRKVELLAEAERVTVAPLATSAEQPTVDPEVQEMPLPGAKPALVPVTVPEPAPLMVTVSRKVAGWKLASAVFAEVMETVQVGEVPEQAPVQPLKMEPVAGEAERATVAPFATSAVQPAVDPVVQERLPPGGKPVLVPVTVPEPAPEVATVSR